MENYSFDLFFENEISNRVKMKYFVIYFLIIGMSSNENRWIEYGNFFEEIR